MPSEFTRKSMRLFATEVAPRLREASAKIYAKRFPHLDNSIVTEISK